MSDPTAIAESDRQSAELAALQRMLSISRGTFSLSIAVCNNVPLRDYIIQKLTSTDSSVRVVRASADTNDVFGLVKKATKKHQPSTVCVIGIEQAIRSDAPDQHVLQALNATRELWARTFSCPIVLWLPEYAAALLSTHARDLWAWKSHEFAFVAPAAIGVTMAVERLPSDLDAAAELDADRKHFRIAELEQRLAEVGDPPAAKLVRHAATWLRELSFLYSFIGQKDKGKAVLEKAHQAGWVPADFGDRAKSFGAEAVLPASLHQLPAPPPDFTGREDELHELLAAVKSGGATISCMQGMGGVGKTVLALVVAEKLTAEYPGAQFFLDLKGTSETPLSPAEALAHVIRGYRPTAQLPEGQEDLAGLYRSVLDGKRALLLMDNAADAGQVRPLVPPGSCLLLVTSRKRFTLPGLKAVNLDMLPPGQARELLLKICRRIGDRAGEIAELCGYLPLGLRAAGSLLEVTADLDPAEYVEQLRDERTRLERIGTEGVEAGVKATLRASCDRLPEQTARAFRLAAVFPGSFDRPAAEAVCEDADHAGMTELVRYTLVEWDDATRRYRLHDLVRLFADPMLSGAERQGAQGRQAGHYRGVLAAADELYLKGGENVLRGLRLFDLEWPNIRTGQAWAAANAEKDDKAAELCGAYPDAGVYCLHLRQHPRHRIQWLEAALTAARRLKDRPGQGAHLGNLGNAYRALDETRRAIECHEQALAIDREIGDRRGEGNALGNLGIAYAALGETRRAIEYHEQASAIHREIGDRLGEGQDLGSLGNAYAAVGETRRAIEYYEQTLAIHREIGDRLGEGSALGALGIAYAALGKTGRAIEYYEQAFAIHREMGDRLGEGKGLGNLGIAYAVLGETRRAIEYFEQQLVIAREIGDRRGEGNALGNLGNAYAHLGETRRAIEYYEQRLVIAREIGDRRGEGNALWNMSLALRKLGDKTKAVSLCEHALEILEEIEDPNAASVRLGLEAWRKET